MALTEKQGDKGSAYSRLLPFQPYSEDRNREISMIMKAVITMVASGLAGVSSQAGADQHDSTTMAKYAAAIRKIESTNRYHITANAGRGRTALGAYQVLDTNLREICTEPDIAQIG